MLRETPIVDSRASCSRSGFDRRMEVIENFVIGVKVMEENMYLQGGRCLLIPLVVACSQTALMFTMWNVKW